MKLYIFISFVTFFLVAYLPNISIIKIDEPETVSVEVPEYHTEKFSFGDMEFGSVKELDNYQDSLPQNKKLNTIEYLMIKKSIEKFQHAENEDELFKKFFESVAHNFPKVLFIYMPIFAFWLWLFHSKKRWYFFEHAIFTLHYFAFMLLLFTIFLLADYLFYLASSEDVHKKVSILLTIVFSGYSFIYFFMAHKRMYYDKSIISFIKSSLLFIINLVLIVTVLILFLLYTFFFAVH